MTFLKSKALLIWDVIASVAPILSQENAGTTTWVSVSVKLLYPQIYAYLNFIRILIFVQSHFIIN